MTTATPEIDPHGSDIARFYDHQRTGAAHPGPDRRGLQQDLRHRPPDRAVGVEPGRPAVARSTPASASSGRCSSRPPAGSGRSGTSPTRRCSSEYGERVMPRAAEWDARWWSPIINAEHLAMRERAGDGRPVGVRDLRRRPGPGACAYLAGPVRQPDRRGASAGSSTRRCSTAAGGILADLTIMRLAHDRFRVVTGGGHGHARQEVVRRPPARGRLRAARTTRPASWTTIGLWGPRARDILGRGHRRRRQSHAGFPFLTCQDGRHRRRAHPRLADLATSASSAGRSTLPMEQGAARLGRDLGGRPAARPGRRRDRRRTRTTGRLEKGYRAHGAELELDFDLVEAGHGPTEGQGRRLRRQGRLPRAALAAAGRGPVHADRRRSRRRRAGSSATCWAASRS